MGDIASLLDRTTPDDLGPLDVGGLARRGRRRRARRRALVTSAAMSAVVALGAVAVTALGGGADRSDLTVPAAGPNGEPLVEPVGAWARADEPPFSPRVDAFGGTLADGRALVWGGHGDAGEGAGGVPTGFADGGILDPATGEWEPIPAAPVPSPTVGGMSLTSAQLVDDRLAVVTGSADGGIHAAVYDVAEGRWVDAPEQGGIEAAYDAAAWDGETLAVVRTRPREVLNADDAGLGSRLAAPVTLRWQPGDDRWTTGAAAPVGLRFHVGAAFDGTRLALWGGTGDGTSVANDGAIYDLAADTWAAIPEGPLAGRSHAATAWSDGRLIVGGGLDGLRGAGDHLPDMAAYDPAAGMWEALPAAPHGGLADARSTWRYAEGDTEPLVARSAEGTGEPGPGWFYGPDGWEQAPLGAVTSLGGLTVATLDSRNFGPVPYDLEVRAAPGEWLDAAGAPFDNRVGATTVTTPDGLLVVAGGREGGDLDLTTDTWVYNLTGQPEGA